MSSQQQQQQQQQLHHQPQQQSKQQQQAFHYTTTLNNHTSSHTTSNSNSSGRSSGSSGIGSNLNHHTTNMSGMSGMVGPAAVSATTMEESMLDFSEIESLSDFLQDDLLVNSDQWQMDPITEVASTNPSSATQRSHNPYSYNNNNTSVQILDSTPEEECISNSNTMMSTISVPTQAKMMTNTTKLQQQQPQQQSSSGISNSLMNDVVDIFNGSNSTNYTISCNEDFDGINRPILTTPHMMPTVQQQSTNPNNNNNNGAFSNTTTMGMTDHQSIDESESSLNIAKLLPTTIATSRNLHTSRSSSMNESGTTNMSSYHNNSATDVLSYDTMVPIPAYVASTVPVEQPNHNDVLLGRGGKNNQWSGNETLRELARSMSSTYSAAPKRNKPAIASILVGKIRSLSPPGRFLKQEQAVGAWIEVDEEVAREKASQCLRDIVAALLKNKTGGGNTIKNGDKSNSSLTLSASTTNLKGSGSGNMMSSNRLMSSASTSTLLENNRHRSVASFFGSNNQINTNRRNESNYNSAVQPPNKLDGIEVSSSNSAAQSGLALLRMNNSNNTGGNSTAVPITRSSSLIAPSTGVSSNSSDTGNAEWNFNANVDPSRTNNKRLNTFSSMGNFKQTNSSYGLQPNNSNPLVSGGGTTQSAAAKAGLALLQRGNVGGNNKSSAMNISSNDLNSHTLSSSNHNMSRVVSNFSSPSTMNQNFAGAALPNSNSSHAMQISSNNLQDLNNINNRNPALKSSKLTEPSSGAGGNYRFPVPNFDGTSSGNNMFQRNMISSIAPNKRSTTSSSAPNLGDISLFLAKRRRPMVDVQYNDTSNDYVENDNALEPSQIEDQQYQQRTPMQNFQASGRAASMMSLGSSLGKGGHDSNDPLLQRLQMLRSNMMSNPSGTKMGNGATNYDSVRRLSMVREQDGTSNANFNWNTDNEQLYNESSTSQLGDINTDNYRPAATTNMFASLLQPGSINNRSNALNSMNPSTAAVNSVGTTAGNNNNDASKFNCFTGIGAVMGESDDTALQRWIDSMATEDLS